MTYRIQSNVLGQPRIGVAYAAATSGSATFPYPAFASRVDAQDATLGGGAFIWLPGATGVNAGTLVTYDQVNGTVTVGGNPSSGAPVAFASCAVPAGQFAWYQVEGALTTAQKDGTALTAGGTVGLGTVAGTVGATVATRQLLGARAINAATAGATVATIAINDPVIAQS